MSNNKIYFCNVTGRFSEDGKFETRSYIADNIWDAVKKAESQGMISSQKEVGLTYEVTLPREISQVKLFHDDIKIRW
ncbi:MAG: hypothetical protein AABX93_01110 [Nanoarchaeota archaeon]